MNILPVVQSVIDDILHRTNRKRIADLYFVVGEISDFTEASIRRHWSELSTGTAAEHATLHFRFTQAEVQCMACFQKYRPSDRTIHCPYCGSFGAKILTGEEFRLESIQLDND